LKSLPREAVETFLKRFGVSRVRDVKARDEKVACAFVQSLQPSAPAEVDPWS
jgi:hypothetical protein